MTDPALCARVGALLSEYLDDRLEGRRARAVAVHLERCSHCRAELGALRRLGAGAASLATPAPDPTLAARARGDLEPDPWTRLLPWSLGLGAAAAAAAACMVAYELGRRAGPDEAGTGPQPSGALVRVAPLADPVEAPSRGPLPEDEVALRAARSVFADLELIDAVPAALREPLLTAQLRHWELDRWATERGAGVPALAPVAGLLQDLEQVLAGGAEHNRLAELRQRAGAPDLWQVPPLPQSSARARGADLERLLDELGGTLPGETRRSMGQWIASKEAWLEGGGDAGQLSELLGELVAGEVQGGGAFVFPDLGGLLEEVQWTVGEDGSRRGELHLEQELPGGRRVIHFEAHRSGGARR